MSIFSGLITSKTRIKILMRLFLNPEQQAYLRELAGEFSISSSQVAEELQQLNEAGLVTCRKKGRQINYQANTRHILFPELHSMVKKSLGMDYILESVIPSINGWEEKLPQMSEFGLRSVSNDEFVDNGLVAIEKDKFHSLLDDWTEFWDGTA